MIKVLLFDLARVILFPKDTNYTEELNLLHRKLATTSDYNFNDHFYLNEDMITYLRILKEKINIFMFTSGSIQNAPEIKGILENIFKKIFSAEELGLSKKDPQAYLKVAEIIGYKPEDILFIDDNLGNISAAQQANLNIYQYKEFIEMKKYLSGNVNLSSFD